MSNSADEIKDAIHNSNVEFDSLATTPSELSEYFTNLLERDFVEGVELALQMGEALILVRTHEDMLINFDTKSNAYIFNVERTDRPGTDFIIEIDIEKIYQEGVERHKSIFGQIRKKVVNILPSKSNSGMSFKSDYSDESMAFLKANLDRYTEVPETYLYRERDGRLRVAADIQMEEPTLGIFSDLSNLFGYGINSVVIDADGIKKAVFEFTGTTEFTNEDHIKYLKSQKKKYRERKFRDIQPKTCEKGHTIEPTLLTFDKSPDDGFNGAEKTDIGGYRVYRVPIEDEDGIFLKPKNLPSETAESKFTSVVIKNGFFCSECGTSYPVIDEVETFREKFRGVPTKVSCVSIPDTEEEFYFVTLDSPIYPIGHEN